MTLIELPIWAAQSLLYGIWREPKTLLCLSLLVSHSISFQSDELLADDDDFGLEGGSPAPEIRNHIPVRPSTPPPTTPAATRRRSSDSDSDSKLQFTLEHAFGDSDFSPPGYFTARLKSWPHGGQELLRGDKFYRIRLPSNVLSPPGRNYTVSSTKARCLPRESLDEHFVIHMEDINIAAVNYGSIGACPHPRPVRFPAKWFFNSHTLLKYSEQGARSPVFTEVVGENGVGEEEMPPEKSFWAKYWMYLVPLGFVVMNAMSQAMSMPEEQAGSGSQGATAAGASAVRRR